MRVRLVAIGSALLCAAWVLPSGAAEVTRPVSQRFADPETEEVPDFQRHVLPLFGRLGCNSRSCHGSFQGRGGFRLSLFGYDFKMDHEALLKKDSERIDTEAPEISKVLSKPTLGIPHKGGKLLEADTWEYHLLYRWIEAGAKPADGSSQFDRLEIVPAEIVFQGGGESVPLKVIAHWADGTQEDVTCITRFQTNDETVAEISKDGVVTSKGKGDTHVVAFYDNGVAPVQVILPVSDRVGSNAVEIATPTRIDELVAAKLRKLGIVPAPVCSDAEFLRRVSLDLTGTLPTAAEVEKFLNDTSSDKRAKKVDELLTRPAYSAYWTNRLCDLTGATPNAIAGQVGQVRNRFAEHWYQWIYSRVAENMPYDKLVGGIVLASSRRPGQSYDDYIAEQTSYYRDTDPADFTKRETMPYFWARRNLNKPEEKAMAFSYAFLGVRLECAQCHKHPFDQWTQDDFNGFAAFFRPIAYGVAPEDRQRSRELLQSLDLDMKNGANRQRQLAALIKEGKITPWQEVFVLPPGQNARKRQATAGSRVVARLLGGDEIQPDSSDPRAALMDWLRSKDNPYFARSFVNRVWANYFGRGIIHPTDDLNLANPPSNAALLNDLTHRFIDHEFDLKWLHRTIIASQAYQRSWEVNETNRLDERNFSHALVRRLPAEVLIDAVALATAGSTEVKKLATEVETRAIGPRATATMVRNGRNDYAGRVFGRSQRDINCDCSRSDDPNLLQAIYLQNDQELLALLDRKGSWLAERAQAEAKAKKEGHADESDEAWGCELEAWIREAYFRTLSREPNDHERSVAQAYLTKSGDTQKGLRDLLWALLNTKEFLTNH